jgi:iron complex transport system permease protein
MSGARRRTTWILILAPPIVLLVALLIGRYGVRPDQALRALFGFGDAPGVLRSLILRIRLPRALASAAIGANLAVCGAAFQGLFRNPLVDSRILGVSSGAAFGAALALLLSGGVAAVQGAAFGFALVAVGLVTLVGWRFGASTLVIVLGGMLIGALFQALLGLIQYVADPLSKLPAITYWLLGGLSGCRWSVLPPLWVVTGLGLAFFLLIRWRLNLLSLADAEARALGVRIRPLRIVVIFVGTVMVAASVAIGGTIGWIGLFVPHFARAWVGPDHDALIPASAAIGAVTLLVLDTVARTALPGEIPLGILTGLIGVPAFFFFFLRFLRSRGEAR